jgi:hypothetical protein
MTIAIQILEHEKSSAQNRLEELSLEVRSLRQRLRDIEDAIQILGGQQSITPQQTGTGSKLRELILLSLNESGVKGATVKEVANALVLRGRDTSEQSISSTLSRMKNDDEVENRNGKWFAAKPIAQSVLNTPITAVVTPNSGWQNRNLGQLSPNENEPVSENATGSDMGSSNVRASDDLWKPPQSWPES